MKPPCWCYSEKSLHRTARPPCVSVLNIFANILLVALNIYETYLPAGSLMPGGVFHYLAVADYRLCCWFALDYGRAKQPAL